MNWHTLTPNEALRELEVSPETGLDAASINKRVTIHGKNILEAKKNKSLFSKFLSQFSDFMIIILIAAAGISFFMSILNGHADFADPIIILSIILLNAVLGVLQETKAERSLDALQKMSAPAALVLRNEKRITIPSKDLVPGDIIYLEAGHYIPADARLISSVDLRVDESALTGESHPAEKDAQATLPPGTPAADRNNMVYSTGIVTNGRGIAVVTSIGMQTEVGHIAKLIMTDEQVQTPLQKKLAQTGKMLGIAAIAICVIIFVLGILKKRPVFDMFMTSVSLAVAAIPEGLPAIVTIMLSLGVTRMAKKKAIIRKLPAVETLGSATVICSDKTGTLTQNKMTVTQVFSPQGQESETSRTGKQILTMVSLCNNSLMNVRPAKKSRKKSGESSPADFEVSGEPTETALVTCAANAGLIKPELDAKFPRIREIPFDSARKMMTTVHTMPSEGKYLIITKGAFDVLLKHCTGIRVNDQTVPLTDLLISRLTRQNLAMTEKALRVIAVATKETSAPPHTLTNDRLEQGLTFLGLVGMIDPPRPEVRDAVELCKKAGIRPVMITGDHVLTACAIAGDLGILTGTDEAITGEQLSAMPFEALCESIYRYRVFARVSPEHKVKIVKAFQSRGEVVAMTGDGVNDAPALKSADIGCAMGLSGTDVAKNAADMILMDDNFATIVSAVREGRGIYDNIRKSIHFLLSSNIGEIMCIFTAILFGLPSPLLAVQLLWVNLVTDSLPAIALGVDPPAKDIMDKKPVPANKGMFADGLGLRIALEGMMIGALSLIAFIVGIRFFDAPGANQPSLALLLTDVTPKVGRTMAFAVLSLSQLFHAFNMRSEHSIFKIGLFTNKKLCLSFLVCTFLQTVVISVPALAAVFKVVPLSPLQWFITIALSIAPIAIVELQKKYISFSERRLFHRKMNCEQQRANSTK